MVSISSRLCAAADIDERARESEAQVRCMTLSTVEIPNNAAEKLESGADPGSPARPGPRAR